MGTGTPIFRYYGIQLHALIALLLTGMVAIGVALPHCLPSETTEHASLLGETTLTLGVFFAIVVGIGIGATLLKRSRSFGSQFFVYENGVYYQEECESTFIALSEIARSNVQVMAPRNGRVPVHLNIGAPGKSICTAIMVPQRDVNSITRLLRKTKFT